MGNNKGKTIIIIVIGAVALAWLLWPSSAPSTAEQGLGDELVNRIWIDRLPKSATEKINVFVMIDDPQVGAFQTTSAYEGDFTVFEWRQGESGKIRVFMLQTEKTHKIRARVSNKDCGRFDLCMKLKGAPRGPKGYFSMSDWVIDSADGLDRGALDTAIRHKLFEAR